MWKRHADESTNHPSKNSSRRDNNIERTNHGTLDDDDDDKESNLLMPRVVFGNLHYRQVCAPVFQSYNNATYHDDKKSLKILLCMTVRYPFAVPPDYTTSNSKMSQPALPIPEHYYNLTELIWVDGPLLDECRRRHLRSTSKQKDHDRHPVKNNNRMMVYHCLERHARRRGHSNAVVAVWTRTTKQSITTTTLTATATDTNLNASSAPEMEFFGTRNMLQQQRMRQFFHQHVLLIVGDSNGPAVTLGITQLFDNCYQQQQHSEREAGNNASSKLQSVWVCPPSPSLLVETNRTEGNNDYSNNDDAILVTHIRYHPVTKFVPMPNQFLFRRPWHVVNDTEPLLQVLQSQQILEPWRFRRAITRSIDHHEPPMPSPDANTIHAPLRPLALLVQYPSAHVQTNDMIQESIDQVRYNQETFPQLLLDMTTRKAQKQLAKMGFHLAHVIVWDGLPQHFPTPSGGYDTTWFTTNSLTDGSSSSSRSRTACQGPLPPNSILRTINQWGRRAWEQNGLNMRYYGHTWEFSNQFWWQEQMLRDGGPRLDCTHGHSADTGLTMVHKYFLQAMVDGYYDSLV